MPIQTADERRWRFSCPGTLVTVLTTPPGSLYSIAVWAALAVLAGPLHIRLRGLSTRLSVRFFVVLVSVAVLHWPETAAIACLSALVESALWTKPRPSWTATVFHGAVAVLATSAAYATYHVPAGVSSPLLMVMAAIVYFVVSSIALAKFDARVWKQSFFWTFPHYVAGGSAAGLLTIADRHNGWQITLLVVPMLYWMVHAYKLYLERIEQERRGIEEFSALHFRTIESLAVAIEGRDPERRKHKRSVWSDALEIGRQMGLPDSDLLALRTAALLRNVGKLAVPEHILSKPGRLTKAEFDKMKIHPVAGAQIVEQAGFPYPVAPIVRSSHEKWDGTGYPAGLRGEQIPLGARILAAVDCLDALVSTRGYRRAYSLEQGDSNICKPSPGKASIRRWSRSWRTIIASWNAARRRRRCSRCRPIRESSPIAAARQEVQQLFALAQDLGNSLSLDETFAVLSQHVKQLCPHDTLAVYIRREDRLEAQYATGLDCLQVGSAVVAVGRRDLRPGRGHGDGAVERRSPGPPGPSERRRSHIVAVGAGDTARRLQRRGGRTVPVRAGEERVHRGPLADSLGGGHQGSRRGRKCSQVSAGGALGRNRYAHRAAQRAIAVPASGFGTFARPAHGSNDRRAGVRSGRVQADQRPVRPSGRQSRAAGGGASPAVAVPGIRHGGAAGRRRVRAGAARAASPIRSAPRWKA